MASTKKAAGVPKPGTIPQRKALSYEMLPKKGK